MRPHAPAVLLAALLCGCMPKIETRRVDTPYPLRDFHGPDTVPEAPAGTLRDADLNGTWRVVSVVHGEGDPNIPAQFAPNIRLRVGSDRVVNVQGLPPEFLVPVAAMWRLNRVDKEGAVLGFGYDRPTGQLTFLHYAFVMAARDGDRALAQEMVHFEENATGAIRWTIWDVTLERTGPEPPVRGVPAQPLSPNLPE